MPTGGRWSTLALLPTTLLTTPTAQERSEAAFRHNLSILMATTAGYAGFAAIRGWLFSLVNTNMLQRLRCAGGASTCSCGGVPTAAASQEAAGALL